MLIKPEINYELLDNVMENDILSIWPKIAKHGPKKLIIGGLYREHKYIRQPDNGSADIRCQEDRWHRVLNQWISATAGADSIILGDINLDHARWNNPVQSHINMVEATKSAVETKGFYQIISDITRTWPGAQDSVL